ncbi:hypothetical protein DFQ28_003557 [Apophysomyces sp. BC1034]|nr:hypothetical protein DFQ30_003599 [Apophysomyces sp. BC1015]KAG0178957.1 hypothetical protein DFQ28_003557 [Apophysomyces sp. BC1034]
MSSISNFVNSPATPMNVDSATTPIASVYSPAPGLNSTELGEMHVQHLQQHIQCYTARCQELKECLESDFGTKREKESKRALLECEDTIEAYCKQLHELEEDLWISSTSAVAAESAGLGGLPHPITHGMRNQQPPMVDPMSLPLLQWRTPQGEVVIVDDRREMHPSTSSALQRFTWSLCPLGCDETHLPVNWPTLIQKAMNGSQLEWYHDTFL